MHAVVSLLDSHHSQVVHDLWSELKREFALDDIARTPIPHFSWHVADNYDFDRLAEILRKCALEISGFDVATKGLALFTGPDPVIYIPIVKDRRLLELHERIWSAVDAAGAKGLDYYHPERWIPHLALAHGSAFVPRLRDIVGFLATRDFNWRVTIDNLAIIQDNGVEHTVRLRAPVAQHSSVNTMTP